MRTKLAKLIAGHLGPAFEDLPKDKVEYMKSRYTATHISDDTQESILAIADEILELVYGGDSNE